MGMKRMASAACGLALAGIVVAGPALAVPGNRVEREEKHTVDVSGKAAVTIKNPRGRTVVVGKPGLKSVMVIAVKSGVGRDDEEANRMIDRLEIAIGEHGDRVMVETKYDDAADGASSLWSFVRGGRKSAWVDYTIEVPFDFDVDASTASGEVRISNISGDAAASATSGDVGVRAVGGNASVAITSGDVEVVEVGGDLDLSATSGDVVIDNVRGGLKADGTSGDFMVTRIGKSAVVRLTSGDLRLEGCSGDVSFRTASGDASIDEVKGNVDASSSSGDIEVLIVPERGRTFNFSSSSGDVDVYYVPIKDFGFNLEVRTNSGSIEGDLPIKVSRIDRRQLTGVVGSGGASVVIETASGNVTILERNDSAGK